MKLYHISVVRICITLTIFCPRLQPFQPPLANPCLSCVYLSGLENGMGFATFCSANEEALNKKWGNSWPLYPKLLTLNLCLSQRFPPGQTCPAGILCHVPGGQRILYPELPACLQELIKNQDASTKCFGIAFGEQGQHKSKFNITCFKISPYFSDHVAGSGLVDLSSPKPHPTPKGSLNSSHLCPSLGFSSLKVPHVSWAAEIRVLFHANVTNHLILSKSWPPSVPSGISDVFHLQPTPSKSSWNC